MPMNRDARMVDIHIMVMAAFFDSGGRKAFTPFEITSMPVTAEQPAAKARRTKNRVRVSVSPGLVGRRMAPGLEKDLNCSPTTREGLGR